MTTLFFKRDIAHVYCRHANGSPNGYRPVMRYDDQSIMRLMARLCKNQMRHRAKFVDMISEMLYRAVKESRYDIMAFALTHAGRPDFNRALMGACETNNCDMAEYILGPCMTDYYYHGSEPVTADHIYTVCMAGHIRLLRILLGTFEKTSAPFSPYEGSSRVYEMFRKCPEGLRMILHTCSGVGYLRQYADEIGDMEFKRFLAEFH